MYNKILLVILLLTIYACGGGGGGGSNGDDTTSGSPEILNGTAATGIAIDGTVNVYGINGGSILDVPIDASGNYTADVTGLTPPFFLSAVPNDSSLATQYSFASGPGVANVTPMTTLTLYYANGDQNPSSLADTWPSNQASVSANIANTQAAVNANFVGVFEAIDSALNVDFLTYDFFTSVFNIGGIYDQILDLLIVEITNDTLVITINGVPFTFDPNIDTSGIDIGGTSGGSGEFGSLSITGADTSVIGTSYVPTIQTGQAGETTALVWDNVAATAISIGGSGSDLTLVTFNFSQLVNGQLSLYSYALVCGEPSNDCSNLQLDLANGVATFNNLVMPLSGANNNAATDSITLNGTLNWTVSATPTITGFTTSDTTITAGESVNLTATFVNGTGIIDNGVGAIVSGSTVSVSPSQTTTYTLTVSNDSGDSTASVTIIVSNSGGDPSDFGSLTVSGSDTPVIGANFLPRYMSGTLDWGRGNTLGDNDGTFHRLVALTENDQLSSVMYFYQDINPNPTTTYSYSIDCSTANCSAITLDLGAATLSFSNAVLGISPTSINNLETGPVTLNGTLNVQ
ncbi:MAG: hypothetical protein AB2687_13735 [Candidatus Thiodiazotropha taylori]